MFVSLLASIALAIAMIAVPAPKAEAQTPGVGSRGISFIPEESGFSYYTNSKYGDDGRIVPVILTVQIGGVVYRGYCIEPSSGIIPKNVGGTIFDWEKYRSDAPTPNKLAGDSARQAKLSWVAPNSYPAKTLEEISALLGMRDFKPGEAVPATQAAVQYYSDGIIPDFQSVGGSSKNRSNIQAFYDYLTGPANVGISNEKLTGVGGRAFVPDEANGQQDVIIFPPSDGSSTPSTTNQVPPTQPTTSTTSTKTSTSTKSTTPTSPAPVTPENEVQIRTQASFYKDRVVQRIPGKAPSNLVWDRVEIDNLEPGYFYELSTRQYNQKISASKPYDDWRDVFEFSITSDRKVVKEDGQPTETFKITSVNPDGTVNGFINAFQDDGFRIKQDEFAYLSQTLVRWKLESDGDGKDGDEMLVATHDGSKFPSQYVYPYQGFDPPTLKTSASFVEGKYDNDRVDLVEIPEGGQAPAYVYDKVYLTNLVPNIKYVLQGQLMRKTDGKDLGETCLLYTSPSPRDS